MYSPTTLRQSSAATLSTATTQSCLSLTSLRETCSCPYTSLHYRTSPLWLCLQLGAYSLKRALLISENDVLRCLPKTSQSTSAFSRPSPVSSVAMVTEKALRAANRLTQVLHAQRVISPSVIVSKTCQYLFQKKLRLFFDVFRSSCQHCSCDST